MVPTWGCLSDSQHSARVSSAKCWVWPSVGGFQSIRVPPLIMHFNRISIGCSIINHSFTHFGVASFMAPPSCRPDPSHLSGAKADRSCGMLWAASVGTASSNASRSSFELPGERQICGRPMFPMFPHPPIHSIFMGKPSIHALSPIAMLTARGYILWITVVVLILM